MKSTLLNLVSFKAGWVATVAGAAASMPAIGVAGASAVVFFHLARTRNVRAELPLLVAAALIGLAWESALVATGLIGYETGFLVSGFAPYWIVAMWVLFATTLNHGMLWLRKNALVAAIAGGIGGPLAFVAGERMGAVTFADPLIALVIIGAGWAALLPMLVRLAVYFENQAAEWVPVNG